MVTALPPLLHGPGNLRPTGCCFSVGQTAVWGEGSVTGQPGLWRTPLPPSLLTRPFPPCSTPSLPSPLHTPPDSTPLPPLAPLQDSERATYRRSEVSPGARERRLEKDNSALQVSGPSRTPHCLLSHHSRSHPATGGLTLTAQCSPKWRSRSDRLVR